MNDTGLNLPESRETLLLQQRQLLERKKLAQMFPVGTAELPLPEGFERAELLRGVFHYDPTVVSMEYVVVLSLHLRENLLLGLGPYNKNDIIARVLCGEKPVTIVELLDGVEVKAAIGTEDTMKEQLEVFESLRLDGSLIVVTQASNILQQRAGAAHV